MRERYVSRPDESAVEDISVVVNPRGKRVEALSRKVEMSTQKVMGWELKVPSIP